MALFSSIMCFDLAFIIVVGLSNMLSFRIIIFYESCVAVSYRISYQNVSKTRQLDLFLTFCIVLVDLNESFVLIFIAILIYFVLKVVLLSLMLRI